MAQGTLDIHNIFASGNSDAVIPLDVLAERQGVKPTNFTDLLGTPQKWCDCAVERSCLWHEEFGIHDVEQD